MDRIERTIPKANGVDAAVYEFDRSNSYIIVIDKHTGVEKGKGLHSQLEGAGIRSVILITDSDPEGAVAVFKEDLL